MNRLLALVAIGAVAFAISTAGAASLGSSFSASQLGAGTATIEGCGKASYVTVTYELVNDGTSFQISKVILTSSGGLGTFTSSPSCVGGIAKVNLGATQVFSRALTSGDFTSAGAVLTLDVTDTSAGSTTNISVAIQGG